MAPGRSYQVGRERPHRQQRGSVARPLTLSAQNGETTISGEGFDAAMLSGVLRTIERLGLELVAVRSSLDDEPDRS